MSRVRFMSTGDTVADCHVVAGTPFLGFPWKYSETPIADLAPLAVDQDDLIEWWWRLKKLTLTFSTTGDLATMPSGTVTLNRKGGANGQTIVTGERELCYPGADRTEAGVDNHGWYGTATGEDFDGLGGYWTVTATVRLCTYGNADETMDVDPDAILHRSYYDNGIAKWKPTLIIDIRLDVWSVSDALAFIKAVSYTTTDTVIFTLGTSTFLPANGGGAVTMTASDALNPSGGHVTQMSVAFTPLEWFAYANGAGEAVWNTATGAQLLNPRQDPV